MIISIFKNIFLNILIFIAGHTYSRTRAPANANARALALALAEAEAEAHLRWGIASLKNPALLTPLKTFS